MARPLQELIAQMPSLLLQYKMQQDRNALDETRFETANALEAQKYLLDQNIRLNAESSAKEAALIKEWNEVTQDILKIAGPDSSLVPELHRTSAGDIEPAKIQANFDDMYADMINKEVTRGQNLRSNIENIESQVQGLRSTLSNLDYLSAHKNKVAPNLTGDPSTIDADDMLSYFDNVLSGDGKGQFSPDDPNYTVYREIFGDSQPGFAEDVQMRATLEELSKGAKAGIRNELDTAYAGLQAVWGGFQIDGDETIPVSEAVKNYLEVYSPDVEYSDEQIKQLAAGFQSVFGLTSKVGSGEEFIKLLQFAYLMHKGL